MNKALGDVFCWMISTELNCPAPCPAPTNLRKTAPTDALRILIEAHPTTKRPKRGQCTAINGPIRVLLKELQYVAVMSQIFSTLFSTHPHLFSPLNSSQPLFNLFSTSFQPLLNLFSTSFQPLLNLFSTSSQPLLNLF